MEGRLRCEQCGHELSMYHMPERERGERLASRVADRVATWWFPTAVLGVAALWVAVNVALRPLEPYPMIVFATIGTALATIATIQGPLILLEQRRSAMRDRTRDEEAFRVTTNAEADIHRLETKLDRLESKIDRMVG